MTAPEGPRTEAPRTAGLLRRLVPAAWLVLVWVLLWGTFSWANLISGVVVAAFVMWLFPLPHVPGSGWLRPGAALRFLAGFVAEMVRSSLQVARQSLRPGPPIRSSVVEVRLASGSEFVIAMMVETLCLIPGSVVIGVRPAQGLIYAHVLGVDDDVAVADFRAQCARWEASLVRALGRPAAPTGSSTPRSGGGVR